MKFVIYDREDSTYHCGNGEWHTDPHAAQCYETREAALNELDEVDQDQILRDRLRVIPAPPETL